jgi:hypothetical protein
MQRLVLGHHQPACRQVVDLPALTHQHRRVGQWRLTVGAVAGTMRDHHIGRRLQPQDLAAMAQLPTRPLAASCAQALRLAPQHRGIAFALVALVAFVAMLLLRPFPFLMLAGAVVALVVPALHGLLLFAPLALAFQGASRGAFMGAVAAFWTEMLMLLTGKPTIGVLATGTRAAPLVVPQSGPVKSLLDYRWLAPPSTATPVASATPGDSATPAPTPVPTPLATGTPTVVAHGAHLSGGTHLITLDVATRTFTPFVEHPQLLAEIGLWALAAGVAGALIYRALKRYGRFWIDRCCGACPRGCWPSGQAPGLCS